MVVCNVNLEEAKYPMSKSQEQASKYLSYILRHKPDSIGLELDPEGWANIDELLAKADIALTRDVLFETVANNDKKRFAISPDRAFVRANQGHSIKVDLGLEPVEPPEFLYHGTATRFLDSIMKEGLLPQNRQYVHLSPDTETAISVGKRHGKPVILKIHAQDMHSAGQNFFQAANGVWLTPEVPTDALSIQNR